MAVVCRCLSKCNNEFLLFTASSRPFPSDNRRRRGRTSYFLVRPCPSSPLDGPHRYGVIAAIRHAFAAHSRGRDSRIPWWPWL